MKAINLFIKDQASQETSSGSTGKEYLKSNNTTSKPYSMLKTPTISTLNKNINNNSKLFYDNAY